MCMYVSIKYFVKTNHVFQLLCCPGKMLMRHEPVKKKHLPLSVESPFFVVAVLPILKLVQCILEITDLQSHKSLH